jgi:hypothetical protein
VFQISIKLVSQKTESEVFDTVKWGGPHSVRQLGHMERSGCWSSEIVFSVTGTTFHKHWIAKMLESPIYHRVKAETLKS